MKNLFYLIFSCVVLSSCSNENLYEFKDLTTETDYIYRVTAFPEDSTKSMEFDVRAYQTNGYDQIVTRQQGIRTRSNARGEAMEFSVKGYKNNGVLFIPQNNIKRIWIDCYEVEAVGNDRYVLFQHITEEIAPIYFGYNFETGEKIVEYREE